MEKHQKVFFYTNLASKMRLMENLGLTKQNKARVKNFDAHMFDM